MIPVQHCKVVESHLKADEGRRGCPVVRKGVSCIPCFIRLRHVMRLPEGANLLEKSFGQLLLGVSQPRVVEGLQEARDIKAMCVMSVLWGHRAGDPTANRMNERV